MRAAIPSETRPRRGAFRPFALRIGRRDLNFVPDYDPSNMRRLAPPVNRDASQVLSARMKEDEMKDAMTNPIGSDSRHDAEKVPVPGDESPRSAQLEQTGSRQASPAARLPHHLPYADLRGWIAEAEKLGEVRVVTGASWQEEIGMAAELVLHSDTAPCVIFDEIPGCQKGYRVLTNFFGGKAKKMTLGFPP